MAEFEFTDEHRDLREVVRRFSARGPVEWSRLAELGVLGLGVPESSGGSGGTLVDRAIAVEELGAVCAPGPLFGTAYLAIPLLTGSPLLADLCAGTRTACAALTGPTGFLDGAPVVDGSVSGDLGPVVDAGSADVLLCRSDEGALLAVDLHGPGVDSRPLVTLDQTRPQAAVRLDRARATPVDAADLAHALDIARVLLAAEQVGASQHLLDLTVAYAKQRIQFGRPIGSFQAVKHKLADLLVLVEHARSTAYHAAWAPDPLSASIAQATCSAAFSKVAADAVQLHGGIGFTWEHEAHVYFKRAATDAVLLGSAEAHRDRVAALVLDTASAAGAPPVARG